jgi:type III secretion system FlhB-like substrate exporter
MTAALLTQPGSLMYVLTDSQCITVRHGVSSFGQKADDIVAKGYAFKANTIAELAAKMGVPVDTLVATVKNYNSFVDAKKDSELGKTLMRTRIEQAPFYATPRVPTVHHTMGGVKINTDAQAIGVDGAIIPGFYAAGEVTGGIHGTNRLGGNAIADIIVFGRIAGRNAAKGL